MSVETFPNIIQKNTKVFIASVHRNNEYILRLHWNDAVIKLVQYLGPENVYFSTFESGSQDNTKDALRDLDHELKGLGVSTSVVLGKTAAELVAENRGAPGDEGWIMTSRGKKERRRIPYLANLRNRVMEKLDDEAAKGNKYDLVLWLNDVVFTVSHTSRPSITRDSQTQQTEDILTLIATRNGAYDAACSLDFSQKRHIYYDTFALRDSKGEKALPLTWPYFQSSISRNAMMHNLPVPVKSCWNGAVVFKAEPFYALPPLRFRGVSDSLAKYHLEGSECCLIYDDAKFKMGDQQGVWLNPNVRVGYNATAYAQVHPTNDVTWPNGSEKVWGMWKNRWSRWLGEPIRTIERLRVKRRVRQWEAEEKDNVETALHCLINEMQVLFESGWKHV